MGFDKIAQLLDDGILKPTLNSTMEGLTTENMKEAHRFLESGKTIGKVVVRF